MNQSCSRNAFLRTFKAFLAECFIVAAIVRCASNAIGLTATADPHDPAARFLMPLADSQQALHVIASVSPNDVKIFTSFTDFGSPFHRTIGGPVKFEGLDAGGAQLFETTSKIEVLEKGDLQGSSFLNIQLSDSQVERLALLRVTYMGHSVTRRSLPAGSPVATAVAMDRNHVRISFDGRHFGEITVRPSATSSDNSQFIEGDGTVDSGGILDNDYPDEYIDFTDGIKTVATHIKVHVQGR